MRIGGNGALGRGWCSLRSGDGGLTTCGGEGWRDPNAQSYTQQKDRFLFVKASVTDCRAAMHMTGLGGLVPADIMNTFVYLEEFTGWSWVSEAVLMGVTPQPP